MRGVLGSAVSYREESHLTKLAKKGFTKANMRLLWDKDDLIHPYKKGLLIAKAMGVKIKPASWGAEEAAETAAFCKTLSKKSQKK